MYLKLIAFFLCMVCCVCQGQYKPPALNVKWIPDRITIDGVLDDTQWQDANQADNFWQYFPVDSMRSFNKTEVKFLYNDQAIFIGIKAECTKGNKFIVNSLRRDFFGPQNDNVSVVFDTYSDGANAYNFSVNAYGVQREILISGGGAERDNFNATWDVKWRSEGKIYDNCYIIEMEIPFSSIKYKEGGQVWRMQTYRFDLQTNEQSAWSRVPQNQLLSNIAFLGEIHFEKPLGKSKPPIYFIPYVNALASKTYKASRDDADYKLKTGGDAKIAIGNGINLDLTINPDFSNVEVDNVITNLTRFEISLPEKRQFFIDNNDLFANFGNTFNEARPFFSRRIGIVRDSLGNNIENKIAGGLRLSGKLDKNWRVGVLSIQSNEDLPNKIASNNNTMLAVQRKVFSRSTIGAFLINRETFKDYDFIKLKNKFNRVFGLDYILASKDSKWLGKFYIHKSLNPGDSNGNLSSQATITFNNRFWNYVQDWVYIDSEFKSDLGFIPRVDIFKSGNGLAHTFYPKSKLINKFTTRLINVMYFKPSVDFKHTDRDLRWMNTTEFKNQAVLSINYFNNFIFLFNPFDPTRTDGATKLPANTAYRFNQLNLTFQSNNASMFTMMGTSTLGQFFNGNIYSLSGTINFRFMPKAVLSLSTNYDRIVLPKPYNTADIILISPKIDLTFTKSLFWSTLIQYSNQRKSLGINSRLQWRFAPLSDLYLVYNDNYYTEDFGPTFRSINLKMTYWLNF